MSRTITVKGTGNVSVKPDLIILSVSVRAEEAEYEKMMQKASEQLDGLRESITAAGFTKDDLKTTDFGVQPEFDNVKQKDGNYKRIFRAYVCTHSLKLEFDFDMNRLAKTFSALSKSTAEPEFNVQFTVKDKDAVSDTLLKSAADNAKKKAEVLCSASGVSLGTLLSIDYNWGELSVVSPTAFSMPNECLRSCAADIDIEPDDISVSDTVTFVWEIK